jgi:deazaflavin-dependent oxidoreductase (nitroreductase family)
MTLPLDRIDRNPSSTAPAAGPRFGGVLWRLARVTSGLTRPLAGKRWNPVWAIVLHEGRKSGSEYATPVAARRMTGGFVVSLAFGPQVDWYRNLAAAGGGAIRWRGRVYAVAAPEPLDAVSALAAFHPIQRLFLRAGRIDGYVRLPDAPRQP